MSVDEPMYKNDVGSDTPLGITIIAILAVLGGVLGLFGSLALLGSPLPILGIVFGVLSVGQVVVGIGLYSLEPWAYRWTLIIYGFDILVDLVRLVTGDIGSLLGLVVGLIVVAYVLSQSHRFE